MRKEPPNIEAIARNPVAFIDQYIKVNELGKPFALMPHQREILRLAFQFDSNGRLWWHTFVYSCRKKSGKTTINAAVDTWWAFTQEAPNELKIVANDLEQSQARVFTTAANLIRNNISLAPSAEIQTRQILLSNGTTIQALASDDAGAAGSNHGLTSFDELWGFTSERSRRLYEELTPVPTRRNSVQVISSYAGWENESELLWDLYKLGVGKEEHPEGEGERIHPDLPIYANRDAGLLVYWDHESRMPWQTEQYYELQRRSLRPGTYLRMHENRWATAESVFITGELWDPCVDPRVRPVVRSDAELYVGIDASTKGDTSAVVAVKWEGEDLILAAHRIWRPTASQPMDLEETIERYLHELDARHPLGSILCDPYQLHRSITSLARTGMPISEFPQTTANTTLMGSTLFDLLKGRRLRMYPAEDLRTQALSTVAVESPRGWRIAKEKASRKIDAIVALSMACVAAMDNLRPQPRAIDVLTGRDLFTGKKVF